MKTVTIMIAAAILLAAPHADAEDWPMWGRDSSRNMFAPNEKNLPVDFFPGDFVGTSDRIDRSTTRNVKWIAKLGSQCYGNPAVSNGRIYVGTNNDAPRDAERFTGDRSVLNCFDESSGELIWQLNIPKMGTGKVSDWEFLGICSPPTVDGDRVYLVTNLCEVMALDVNGLADGNDGPFQDEAKYLGGKGEPVEIKSTDADILWTLNMIDECGVFPHNITSSSVCVAGDKLWVSTSNGVDYGHVETPAPFAPSLILVDKNTGKLLGEEASGLSERIYHCNWSSPAHLKTGGLDMCIFGGPDGWVYAFSPEPAWDAEEERHLLKELWRFDANKPEYRTRDGKPIKYATRGGPSEVIATPVTHNGRVYVAVGQDPEHGEGVGNIVCIDASGSGDVTKSKELWSYEKIRRSLSTVAIQDGMLFTADFSGFVYCFDAESGALHWRYDTKGHIWGSPLVADGKLYVGNEDGYLTILDAKPEMKLLTEIDMMAPVYSSPIVANGVLYVATHTHLFAIEAPKAGAEGSDAGE